MIISIRISQPSKNMPLKTMTGLQTSVCKNSATLRAATTLGYKSSLIIAITTSLILAGGANASKLQKYDPQAMYAPDQAIVVVKLNNLSYININRLHKASSSIANEFCIMQSMRSFIPYSYSQSIYIIRPGIYYISFLQQQVASNLYHTIEPGIGIDGKIAYGAYDIKPGEVLYLGDYDCKWRTSSRISKLLVTDNLSEVKQDLYRAGYEELAAKITTARLYESGSNVDQIPSSNSN